jgi:hypothetical protein
MNAMLYNVLSMDYSLREGVERLAFSAIWELTPDIQVVSVKFTKSIIKSRRAMTYEEAQNLIDDVSKSDETTASLRMLMQAAKILRKRRSVSPASTGIARLTATCCMPWWSCSSAITHVPQLHAACLDRSVLQTASCARNFNVDVGSSASASFRLAPRLLCPPQPHKNIAWLQ